MSTEKTMSGIIRVIKSENYSVVSNVGIRDKRLSWGARGILTYLLTKPDTWQVRCSDLVNESPHGRHAILAMMDELKRFGYLRQWSERNEKGHFVWHSAVYENPSENPDFTGESPLSKNQTVGCPQSDFPTTDYPTTENQTFIIGKEILNKEILSENARAKTATIAEPAKPDVHSVSKLLMPPAFTAEPNWKAKTEAPAADRSVLTRTLCEVCLLDPTNPGRNNAVLLPQVAAYLRGQMQGSDDATIAAEVRRRFAGWHLGEAPFLSQIQSFWIRRGNGRAQEQVANSAAFSDSEEYLREIAAQYGIDRGAR